jgi:methylenetetrahydrofolate dehydrogenase (NADP+) / methenyltetrahydrofolate cyclohydrolase
MLLLAKPVVAILRQQTKKFIETHGLVGKYVQIFLLSNFEASLVYDRQKKKYGEELGLQVHIYHNAEASIEDIYTEIDRCNSDPECIGMIVQLPLATHLIHYENKIVSRVAMEKDIDGLGGKIFGLSSIGLINFLPATPKSAVCILDFYGFWDVTGKKVLIIGQSNLFGKPFAMEMIKRGATIISGNHHSPAGFLKTMVQEADIIVSATGVKHLIDASWHISDWSDKICIDIGYSVEDGKAYSDIDWQYYKDKVKAITPVPGGVGPVTVAALFHNVIGLQKLS